MSCAYNNYVKYINDDSDVNKIFTTCATAINFKAQEMYSNFQNRIITHTMQNVTIETKVK